MGSLRDRVAHLPILCTSSPAQGRRFAGETLADWACPASAEAVQLVVSELVTNVKRYGGGEGDLRLGWPAPDRIRISVEDREAMVPVLRERGRWQDGGFGLQIIAAMCASWGVDPGASGKTVWCELPVGSSSVR